MNEKKSFSNKLGDFLAGKGFYIVLAVCAVVIGVSAWILLFSDIGGLGTIDNDGIDMSNPVDAEHGSANVPVTADIDWGSEAVFGPMEDDEPAVAPSESVPPSESPQTDNSNAATDNNSGSAAVDEEPAESTAADEPITFIRPVAGNVLTVYAVDELIYNQTMGDWRAHSGIDLAASVGTRVMSVADGVVTDLYVDDMLGTTVVIDHGSGICSIYSNLAATPVVSVGDSVAMGSVIGSVGDTALGEAGIAQHLHFEMTKDDAPCDPADYLPN